MTRRAEGWAADLTRVTGEAVARERRERGWSGEHLLTRLADVGLTMTRAALTNLEAGRREAIGVHEVYALAVAFGIPPVALLVPDPAADIPLLPGLALDGVHTLAWVTGQHLPGVLITDPDGADDRFTAAGRAAHLLREHAAFALDVVAVGHLRRSPDVDELYRRRVSELRDLRAQIAGYGWPLPPLPAPLIPVDVDGPAPEQER